MRRPPAAPATRLHRPVILQTLDDGGGMSRLGNMQPRIGSTRRPPRMAKMKLLLKVDRVLIIIGESDHRVILGGNTCGQGTVRCPSRREAMGVPLKATFRQVNRLITMQLDLRISEYIGSLCTQKAMECSHHLQSRERGLSNK